MTSETLLGYRSTTYQDRLGDVLAEYKVMYHVSYEISEERGKEQVIDDIMATQVRVIESTIRAESATPGGVVGEYLVALFNERLESDAKLWDQVEGACWGET